MSHPDLRSRPDSRSLGRHNARGERINVDARLSLLEIKPANRVDVLPRIGRKLFGDAGGDVVSGGLPLCAPTRRRRTRRRALAVEPRRFHAEADQTFTVSERWAFLTSTGPVRSGRAGRGGGSNASAGFCSCVWPPPAWEAF